MRLILKFDLTFAVADKKINLVKEKVMHNKYRFFEHGWAKKGPTMILYHDSTVRYFYSNTTSISFNSDWYN